MVNQEDNEQRIDAESIFNNLFASSQSGSGEEELLRIAAKFSRQISAAQIKVICFLKATALEYSEKFPNESRVIEEFVERWLELKQFNHSDAYVMRALDSISLRRFINENSFKVNIDKS